MKPINCLVLDDEQPAVNILKRFIGKTPFLNLVGDTTDAFAALDILRSQSIDLLFIDIQMPDITGIELLKSLDVRPKVIFTTAYDEYAMEGYELNVVDYLLKPIRFERFMKAANKARTLHHLTQPVAPKPIYLFVKSDYQTVKIDLADILYIEGLKDYVKIYTTQEMVMTRLNLKGIAAKLPEDQFLRVHRSFIAAIAKITAFQKSQISIKDKVIPIGETYRVKLLQLLG